MVSLDINDPNSAYGQCKKFHSVLEAIFHHGINNGSKLAFADTNKALSYREFATKVMLLSRLLSKRYGIAPIGDRQQSVLVQAGADVDYLCCYFAVELSQAISVPVDIHATASTVAYFAEQSSSRLIIGSNRNILHDPSCALGTISWCDIHELNQEITQEFEQLLHNSEEQQIAFLKEVRLPDPDSFSAIYFTSGTTGKSKPVLLTHHNCICGGFNSVSTCAKFSDDIEILTTPIFHAQAASSFRSNIILGCSSVLFPSYYTAQELSAIINRYHCNAINMIPASLKMLLEDLGDADFVKLFGSMRLIEIGTAPMDTAHKRHLRDLLTETWFLYNYGATECSRTVFNLVSANRQDDYHFARDEELSVLGRVVPIAKVKVIDDNGRELPKKKSGRLIFHGGMVMQRYLNNDEATQATIKNGWYYSNDCGFIDERNYIHILGRMDDIINMGGEKISPQEIEDIVMGINGIKECCCIGAAHAIFGNIPVLYYAVENPELTEEHIKHIMRARLDRMRRPKFYIRLPELPKNGVGKVNRKELKQIWLNSSTAQAINSIS